MMMVLAIGAGWIVGCFCLVVLVAVIGGVVDKK